MSIFYQSWIYFMSPSKNIKLTTVLERKSCIHCWLWKVKKSFTPQNKKKSYNHFKGNMTLSFRIQRKKNFTQIWISSKKEKTYNSDFLMVLNKKWNVFSLDWGNFFFH